MTLLGCNRYKLIVIILLVLIFWQLLKLFSDTSFIDQSNNGKVEDSTLIVTYDKALVGDEAKQRMEVSVFYEALCPDSRHFFLHHLVPLQDKLQNYVDIYLVPYGKAKTRTNKNGELEFECQHGEVECYANKIHACAIDEIPNKAQQLHFTNCMILDNIEPNEALQRCAKSMKVEITSISTCAISDRGSELLNAYGVETQAVKPTFIPTVLLNKSKENQAAILKNLLLEVCDKLEKPLPPACAT